MNENVPKKGERKPLFSISVDDLIIQRIFKTLEDEICKIRVEITNMQVKLSQKAENRDLLELKADLSEYKDKESEFREKVDSDLVTYQGELNAAIAEAKKFVRDQITEATVSLNGVVRAQNAIIEERIFQLSRPDSEITNALADIERVKSSTGVLSNKISSIETFFSSFLNNTGGSTKTLPQLVSSYFEPEREKIRNIELHQKKTDSRIQECEDNITRIVGSNEITFPAFVKAQKHLFSEKPKLPEFTTPKSYTDYFQYMVTTFPVIQKILSSFYHQVVGLANSVYDQAERETSQEDLEKHLEDLTNVIADVRELKEKETRIDNITSKINEINSAQSNMTDLINEIKQLKETTISKAEVDDEIKKAVSQVIQEIQRLKMENSLKNESHQTTNNRTSRKSLPNTLLTIKNPQSEIQQSDALSTAPLQSQSENTITTDNTTSTSKLPPPPPSLTQPYNEEKGENKSRPVSGGGSRPSAGSSSANSPKGSANHRLKGSSAQQSPRIMRPDIHVASSAASTISLPETVVTAVQPKGRAAYRMIFGDGSGSRPSSAASTSSRMSNLTNFNMRSTDDIEEGGRAPKRSQKTANTILISTDGLPEEKDDSFDFLNSF